MFIDPYLSQLKRLRRRRYIALRKECELSVGAAAINMAPLAGLCGFFYE